MDFPEHILKIKSKDDFIKYLDILKTNFINNSNEWENRNINDYLESISAWMKDVKNSTDQNINLENPDWTLIGLLFYIGKFYK